MKASHNQHNEAKQESGYEIKEIKKRYPICPGLTFGTLFQVKIEGLGSALSILTGMEYGYYMILKKPQIANMTFRMNIKNRVILRYLHAGRVYGFTATLIGLINEPFPLMMISYPTSIESINLRQDERVSCLLAGEMRTSKGVDNEGHIEEDIYQGHLSDISMGGGNFKFSVSGVQDFPKIRIGNENMLALDLPEQAKRVPLQVVVRSVKIDSEMADVGLQFKMSGESDTLILKSYIHSIR